MWQLGWEESLRENGYVCIYMAESLRYSPETITTLVTGYTSVQNKNMIKVILKVPSIMNIL